jgi:hypothetical protein
VEHIRPLTQNFDGLPAADGQQVTEVGTETTAMEAWQIMRAQGSFELL